MADFDAQSHDRSRSRSPLPEDSLEEHLSQPDDADDAEMPCNQSAIDRSRSRTPTDQEPASPVYVSTPIAMIDSDMSWGKAKTDEEEAIDSNDEQPEPEAEDEHGESECEREVDDNVDSRSEAVSRADDGFNFEQ
eukprot:2009482-Amphidinium_carterae.2